MHICIWDIIEVRLPTHHPSTHYRYLPEMPMSPTCPCKQISNLEQDDDGSNFRQEMQCMTQETVLLKKILEGGKSLQAENVKQKVNEEGSKKKGSTLMIC